MKTLAIILAGTALALTGTTAALAGNAEENEAKLARMLEGRTAGAPVNCISAINSNRIEVIEEANGTIGETQTERQLCSALLN